MPWYLSLSPTFRHVMRSSLCVIGDGRRTGDRKIKIKKLMPKPMSCQSFHYQNTISQAMIFFSNDEIAETK